MIDFETNTRERAKTLRVIRRMLKKLKGPTSTVIEESGEPPIIHPLEVEESKTKRKPAKKRGK